MPPERVSQYGSAVLAKDPAAETLLTENTGKFLRGTVVPVFVSFDQTRPDQRPWKRPSSPRCSTGRSAELAAEGWGLPRRLLVQPASTPAPEAMPPTGIAPVASTKPYSVASSDVRRILPLFAAKSARRSERGDGAARERGRLAVGKGRPLP